MVGSDTEATVMLNVVPGLNTGITAFNAGLSSINAQFQNVTDAIGQTFGMVDSMIVSSGLMLAQFGMGAANAFGEFEQGMQIVKAVSQQSGQAIAYLKQEAQNFSVQYRTDIDDITAGLQTLGRAGLNSAQEQTEVLEEGLQTAKLEGRELNGVLEEIIQNTSLLGGDIKSNQFGEQAGYLNDLLVGTSLSAPIDTHDISETLKYSGGMLAAAGGTIATEEGYANETGRELVEDYMGAVAAFAQKGVKGSIAGTALRAFFNKPAAQDQSVVDALGEIGLAPEDLWNDEETMKPVSEQIGLIQNQMEAKNVSKMDQMQLWSKIVGGKMGQQMMKLDAQDIREMTTDIQSASSAEDLANQTFNTYNQQMNKFSQEGQKAFREFGEHIVTAVRPALTILTKLMDLLSNPVVSFAGFIAFTTILSHALQAVGRIAGRLKSEMNWLIEGGSNFNPTEMLNNAHKGQFNKPYLDIIKSSDKDKYLTGDMRTWMPLKRERQKTKSDSISQKTNNLKDNFKSFGSNFKSTMSEVSNNINTTMNEVVEKIKSVDMNIDTNIDEVKNQIKSINAVVSEVTEKTLVKAKETADYIIAQNNIIKADILDMAMLGYSGDVGPKSNLVGVTKEELSSHTVPELKSILMDQHGFSGKDLRGLRKDDLIEEIFKLNNYDTSQTINGAAALNNISVADAYENDPYLRQFKTPIVPRKTAFDFRNIKTSPYVVTDEEEMEEFLRTFGKDTTGSISAFNQITEDAMFGGMFAPHISSLPADAQLFADTMNRYNPTKLDIMEENAQLRVENPEEVNILEGIFNSVQDIHNNMVIEDHAVNEAYYDKNTSMRDAITEEQKRLENNHKQFREGFFWDKTKNKDYMMDEGLESLFDDSTSQRYRDKFWSGLTEDEYNRRYYRDNSPSWYTDINDITWAEGVSEETKKQVEQYINDVNAHYGYHDPNRRGKDINEDGAIEPLDEYGAIEPIRDGDMAIEVIPGEHTGLTGPEAGLKALFGEGEVEEFKSKYEPSRREKIRGSLSRASEKLSDKFTGLSKALGSESTSKLGQVVDLFGGKFNMALIGVTAAMELYQYAFGQWQKQAQEHQTNLSEAQDKASEAENNIREAYLKANPDASQADADKAVNDAYLEIADNNYDITALDENTQALYVATYQVQRASDLLQGDTMHSAFGIRGAGGLTNLSDNLVTGLTNEIFGTWGTQVVQDNGEMGYAWGKLGFGYNTQAGSILDNNNQAVLTGSQSSEDYVYSKENAAIFAADVWAASKEKGKEAIDGLWDFFGTDVKHFQEVNRSIFGGTSDFGNSYYTHVTDMLNKNFSSSTDQHQLQMFLKNNKQDAQKLAKDIRKFEKANKGRSPISYFTDKKGGKVPQNKALKNLEVKDKDLVRYLRSLSIKTGMSAQQLLMASQLQQMQDLNQIMSEQLQPQVIGLAQTAYQQLSAQHGIGNNTNSTSSGSWSTYNAASAIASKLNVLVEQALDVEMQQDYINRGGTNQEYIDNPQSMKRDVIAAINTPESQRTQTQKWLADHYGKNYLQSYYLSGWDSAHPDATPEEREAAMNNYWKNVTQYDSYEKMIGATRKGANAYYTQGLLAAYDASSLGEPSSTPSGGSGGSGGDGKDKDKDTGTKKERVDLVLCNKKEIPKLNVNLFKKAPQFTVLNKNFKLRDIRINTQDKPKAVLASLKNAIIDTQKRMDPKIIQDEEAEYDPVGATDGTSTPSGSTSTNTDG